MTDIYRDTDERMRHDADFANAVRMLEYLARQNGYTPGELKQIAFKAALNIEVTMNRSPLQICAHCRGPVTGPGSWMIRGRHFCTRACYVAAGGGP